MESYYLLIKTVIKKKVSSCNLLSRDCVSSSPHVGEFVFNQSDWFDMQQFSVRYFYLNNIYLIFYIINCLFKIHSSYFSVSKIANNLSICIFNVLLRSTFSKKNFLSPSTFSIVSINKRVQIICLSLYALLYIPPNKSSHVEIIY